MSRAKELLANKKGLTPLEFALENYESWYNAVLAISTGQHYVITNGANGRRELSRANLKEAQEMLMYWENEVEKLDSGNSLTAPKCRVVYTR